MFTGIVEKTATILDQSDTGITLERPESFDAIKLGSSICVSGCCLSIVEFDDTSMRFDIAEETSKRTKLGSLNAGDQVNLERAMKADARFEGHVVQGHVDSVGELAAIDGELMTFSYSEDLCGNIVEKGSVAVDGVSLTVVSVDLATFSVAVIAQTREWTTLGTIEVGKEVNLEADIMGKYAQS